MRKVFKSRVSILLTIIVWASLLIPYGFFIKQIFINNNSDNLLLFILIFIIFSLLISFIGLIWFGIRYIIDNDKIVFKIWIFNNGEIGISKIILIERSYNPLASNAASLKRLKFKLKKGSKFPFLLISPDNEEVFLMMLKEINPSIEIDIKNKKSLLNWDF